jgi:hypothetical protein
MLGEFQPRESGMPGHLVHSGAGFRQAKFTVDLGAGAAQRPGFEGDLLAGYRRLRP